MMDFGFDCNVGQCGWSAARGRTGSNEGRSARSKRRVVHDLRRSGARRRMAIGRVGRARLKKRLHYRARDCSVRFRGAVRGGDQWSSNLPGHDGPSDFGMRGAECDVWTREGVLNRG